MTFDLCALIQPPLQPTLIVLYFLEQAGVELKCYSALDRDATKEALRQSVILQYFDDILYVRPETYYNAPLTNYKRVLRSVLPEARWPRPLRVFLTS